MIWRAPGARSSLGLRPEGWDDGTASLGTVTRNLGLWPRLVPVGNTGAVLRICCLRCMRCMPLVLRVARSTVELTWSILALLSTFR